MATVINTPSTRDSSGDGAAAGWAVAVVVLVGVLLLALFVWPGYIRQSAPANTVPNINVTVPGASGGTGGGAETPAAPSGGSGGGAPAPVQ